MLQVGITVRRCIRWTPVVVLLLVMPVIPAGAAGPPASQPSPSSTSPAFPKKTDPIEVLFIGNSYTYAYRMPAIVQAIARSKHCRLSTDMQAKGGYTLGQHWADEQTSAKLASRRWHAVIVQDQSQMPAINPPQTLNFGSRFARLIHQKNARVIFFLTWGRRLPDGSMNLKMQEKLLETYCRVALATGSEVAPVGLAWQKALEKNPTLTLHAKDGSHPTAAGTYLAACVFFATLYNEDPAGAPTVISIPQDSNRRLVLCRLSGSLARFLQKIAWETVTEFRENRVMEKVVQRYEQTHPAGRQP